MSRHRPMPAVLLSLAALAPGALDAQDGAEEAHGVFTGELQAVLYVADVEASSPFHGNEPVFAVTDPARHGIDPWNASES